MKENRSGPMLDTEYWGYHGGRAPACHDCAMFFYGCQQIDGERAHPDAEKHYAKCMQWWDYRHSTAIGEAVVASFESMAKKTICDSSSESSSSNRRNAYVRAQRSRDAE